MLRQGGLAYISEPVYAGDFNDILRLFNGRRRSVKLRLLRPPSEQWFRPVRVAAGRSIFQHDAIRGFEEFERRIIGGGYPGRILTSTMPCLRDRETAVFCRIDSDGIARSHR